MSGRCFDAGEHCELIVEYSNRGGCEKGCTAYMAQLRNIQKRGVECCVGKYVGHKMMLHVWKLNMAYANGLHSVSVGKQHI